MEMKNQILKSKEDKMNGDWYVFIPKNKYGISPALYHINGIVFMLREFKNKPDIIQFIADMIANMTEM